MRSSRRAENLFMDNHCIDWNKVTYTIEDTLGQVQVPDLR